MPQLVAMVLVVVGAIVYMFQTFGGTGDKIEGMAQKTSVITEINNIKDGLRYAVKAGDITAGTVLKTLGEDDYFDIQINSQISPQTGDAPTDKDSVAFDDITANNTYNAISFGGTEADNTTDADRQDMRIALVSDTSGFKPGIFVDLTGMGNNAGFLENQISIDLANIADIDRTAVSDQVSATTPSATEPTLPIFDNGGDLADGKFVVYFKDFGNDVVQ